MELVFYISFISDKNGNVMLNIVKVLRINKPL